jgi:hypothetical protein
MLVMLVHNEASNLRRFLKTWRGVADCYFIGIDDKTDDDSAVVIQEELAGIPGRTGRVHFHNFGQAMNTVLVEAKKAFYPSYLVLAEADWQARPDTWSAATPLIAETASTVFNFRVHSRAEETVQLNTSFRYDKYSLSSASTFRLNLPPQPCPSSFREMSYLLPYSLPAFYKYVVV